MNSESTEPSDPQYTRSAEPAPSRHERDNPLQLLKPTNGYRVTPILLWLNVGIFVLMALTGVNVMQPVGEDLIRWGANYSPLTLGGQPWRLLTSCFLHIGILHLLFNMYALTQIGTILEPLLRSRQFIIAYLTAGLVGSVVSLWWHDVVLGAGASGAIFGLYGVFLALLTTNWLDGETRSGLLRSILIFVGYNLAFGMVGGIDNAAHIGGLLGGLFTGYTYYFFVLRPAQPAHRAIWALLIPPAVAVLLAIVVYTNTPNVTADYERIMQKFSKLEGQAMAVFKLPPNTSAAGVARAINDRGIVAWQQAIVLLDEADKLDLSANYRQRNNLLRQYSTLRLQSFRLLQRSLIDTTHVYDKQIEACDQQIQTIMNQLKSGKK